MGSDPVNGFELKDKRTGARVKPLTLSGPAPLTIRGSDPFGFEKLLANGGHVWPELAGIRQRAVDAASPVADAVRVPETEHGRQLTPRTGRPLAGQPCGTDPLHWLTSRQAGSVAGSSCPICPKPESSTQTRSWQPTRRAL
jgi:hypothetical protein